MARNLSDHEENKNFLSNYLSYLVVGVRRLTQLATVHLQKELKTKGQSRCLFDWVAPKPRPQSSCEPPAWQYPIKQGQVWALHLNPAGLCSPCLIHWMMLAVAFFLMSHSHGHHSFLLAELWTQSGLEFCTKGWYWMWGWPFVNILSINFN